MKIWQFGHPQASFGIPGPEWIEGFLFGFFFLLGPLIDVGAQPVFQKVFR